jgi:DNA-binding NtrC family response regulator
MENAPEVLVAGNCGPDTWALQGLLKELGAGEVHVAESSEEVEQLVGKQAFKLVLLNRVFDSTGELALDILPKLTAEQRSRCMLISNFEDAHQAAVKLGAKTGFGKRQLRDAATRTLLQSALDS